MRDLVHVTTDEAGVARLTMDNPPVNALGHALRQALVDALARAEADPAVRIILLTAAGRTFPAGADIREFDEGPKTPGLSELCNRVEACSKPVIAVIHGTALGGGFELALASHYRIAESRARLGLPEVTLGILPGAGGTQRLPRLAGAEVALEMMLAGKPVSAAEAARLGLVDRVAEGDLATAAVAYAEELLAAGAAPRPTRAIQKGFNDAPAYQQAIRKFRARAADSPIRAPERIVSCVEAAQLLPFEAGLEFEEAAFEDCVQTEGARALRHAFLAERLAGKLPEAEGAAPRQLSRAVVAGAGSAAAGWAASCLDAGLSVSLLVPDEAGQADLAARIAAIHDEAVVRQRMSPAQRDEKRARLDVSGGRAALNAVDLVISVGAEDLAPLEAATRPGAILAAAVPPGHAVTPDGLSRPADLVGLQVTSPAHVARLVEVLSGPGTAPDVLLTLMRLFKKTGRVAVLSPAEEGGMGAAVWGACVWVAEALVSMGAAPEEVDDALRGYGFTRTPFQTRTPRTTRGTPRDFATDEIVQRCLVAMANTGALLVEAGAARRPSDVDMVMIHGYGFPRWHGGPMMAADLTGLLLVKETLKVLTGEDAGFWAPSDLFDELIKNGRHFADLND